MKLVAYPFVQVIQNVKVNNNDVPLRAFLALEFPVIGEEEQQIVPQTLNDGLGIHFFVIHYRLVNAVLEVVLAFLELHVQLNDDWVGVLLVQILALLSLPQLHQHFSPVVQELLGQLHLHFLELVINLEESGLLHGGQSFSPKNNGLQCKPIDLFKIFLLFI